MSDPSDAPVPYQVVYSERVQTALREFAVRAREAGQGPTFVAAMKELDRLLHLYPQFGEPVLDLTHESGKMWNCTMPPLVVRYAIYEDRRLVIVGSLPMLLPNPGF